MVADKLNNPIPIIFSLKADLNFLHGDTKNFTKNEAMRAVINKIMILKDFALIRDYLESVITLQGKHYFLTYPEHAEESLEEFFRELKKLAFQIPDYEVMEWQDWKHSLMQNLTAIDNSACFFAYGRFRLLRKSSEEINAWVNHLIGIISGRQEKKGEKFVSYEFVREELRVKKNETFKKYFKELKIEIYGTRNEPLIYEKDFLKLKDFWPTRN